MDFRNKTFLAPMAGSTDTAMRRLCFSLGADCAVTEMISAKAVCYGDIKTGELSSITKGEGDVVLQLFGHDPGVIADAAVAAAEGKIPGAEFDHLPCAIDINMGCPVKKIVSSGDGSALMREPRLAAEIVKRTSDALSGYGVPLTVKIRSGWDKNSINAPYFAALMAQNGAAAVTVHARTRDQMYAPSADRDVIREVKRGLPDFPVIANGDITSAADAFDLIEYTGCDSVMIGRAALGNPWIFSEISCRKNKVSYSPPDMRERIRTALSMIKEVTEEKGEFVGVREARGRVAHFIKGARGAPVVRDRINRAETYSDIEKILYDCIDLSRDVDTRG